LCFAKQNTVRLRSSLVIRASSFVICLLTFMPTIQPFRGLRYNLGQVGSLSDVVTPPYDVISPEFQEELYKKHPANFIRLELNRDEPGDSEQSNKYARAAKFLKNWRSEGVMQVDPDP